MDYKAASEHAMDRVAEKLRQDKFAQFVGIELVEVSLGRAKARLELQPHHLNSLGIVQGGAVFTLADFAFAAASNSHGTAAVAINVNISYVKASREGTLIAEAEETSRSSKLGHYTVRVTDDSGGLVAIFQGMVFRKKESIFTQETG